MTTQSTTYHVPVLLRESIVGLNIQPEGVYVDVTFGGGGHSRAILEKLGTEGHLFSFDQDADAEQNVRQTDADGREANFTFVRSNFRYLKNWMRYYGVEQIDGLLADLGVSSHHFDDESRGFSFRFDAPLDMRMNRRAGATAADVLNNCTEEQLADILFLYGEMRNARPLARRIVAERSKKPLQTTGDLLTILEPLIRRDREKKDLARIFQALRIEVNGEMIALRSMLLSAVDLLKPGGRLAVITYHSLEDRMVKNLIKSGNTEGKVESNFFGVAQTPLRAVNNKPILPSADEQTANPRSRSAKLRIAEKQ